MQKVFQQQPPKEETESDVVNDALASKILGFPFNYDDFSGNERIYMKINAEIRQVKEAFLDMYWSGNLEETKRNDYLRDIVQENMKHVKPLKGEVNLYAFRTQNPNTDPEQLIAVLLLYSRLGGIDDIIAFLELSKLKFGEDASAGAKQYYRTRFSNNRFNFFEKGTPEQRLVLWPAANAIIKQPTETVPLLLNAIKDPDLRIDLRYRAATFINTLNPDFLDEDLLNVCDNDFAENIRTLKKYKIKWRENLPAPDREFEAYFQEIDVRMKHYMKARHGVEIENYFLLKKEEEAAMWGQY